MKIAPLPTNESERLLELYRTELLDSSYEEEFNDIVLLASKICNVPISLISLIDANRQWFKAKFGIDVNETERNISFCSHAILGNEIMEVRDAHLDERFVDNPLVLEDPSIRYYAGVPLVSTNGYKIGTLCVIDTIPRDLDEEQMFALKVLATQIMKLVELRMQHKELKSLSELQNKILSITAHDVRNPLSSLYSLIDLQEKNSISPQQSAAMIPMIRSQLTATLELLNNLVDWGKMQMHVKAKTRKEFNLSNLVQACINELFLNASLKLNVIINNLAFNTVITGDENAIRFILRNLLTNANKFTFEGTITIDYTFQENKHIITVTDTGVGMELNKLNPLHNNSHKSAEGTNNEKGSGLGIMLIKEQLQNMDGDINIQSEKGMGTTVSFSFA